MCATETIRVEPHSQMLIRVPHQQQITKQNVLVEPAFTLFRQPLTAARVLDTVHKPWVPVMLLNTPNEAVSLPRSFCLVHCAVLEDQPVRCGCSVPNSQNYASGPAQQGPSEQELQSLIASLGIRELNLPPRETDEVIALIREYADVFASSDVDLGRTNVVQHSINTGRQLQLNSVPIASLTVRGPNSKGRCTGCWMQV